MPSSLRRTSPARLIAFERGGHLLIAVEQGQHPRRGGDFMRAHPAGRDASHRAQARFGEFRRGTRTAGHRPRPCVRRGPHRGRALVRRGPGLRARPGAGVVDRRRRPADARRRGTQRAPALFERPRQACRSTIALRVDAAAFLAWRSHLAAALLRGAEPQDHALSWSMYFADPDGNPYEITCYDYAALAPALQDVPAR